VAYVRFPLRGGLPGAFVVLKPSEQADAGSESSGLVSAHAGEVVLPAVLGAKAGFNGSVGLLHVRTAPTTTAFAKEFRLDAGDGTEDAINAGESIFADLPTTARFAGPCSSKGTAKSVSVVNVMGRREYTIRAG